MCPFSRSFCTTNYNYFELQGIEVTHRIVDDVATRLPDAFHYLVPNDNFHYQTPLKNAKFDLFGSEKIPVGKSGCEQRLANCNSPTR